MQASARIIVTAAAAALMLLGCGAYALPLPDSAGMAEMINGLAYGGIPYGSVSGQLANYVPAQQPSFYQYNGLQQYAASASVVVPKIAAPLRPIY